MKTIIITGGTRGIGKAIALKFAENEYNLVLNYINNEKKAIELKEYIEKNYKSKVLLIKGDISDEDVVKNLLNETIKTFNRIDILVNNAAIANDTILEDKTKEDFKKILDINLVGPFLTCKHIGKYMYENKNGKIINISSTNAIDTYYPESMDYDASKAGLISLTHNFATLYSPFIQVNSIAPGWVNTDMNKNMDIEYKKQEEEKILLKRFAEPEEIATLVYYLGNESTFINNSVIRIDGGTRC